MPFEPRLLDAACGTGLVARALKAGGLAVLGVGLDARMAVIARRHGVDVEVARFGEWNDDGRRFDTVTFGDTWHWIDPERGISKVAEILEPGGTLVRFFSRAPTSSCGRRRSTPPTRSAQLTGYLGTVSDHRRQPPEVLGKLLDAVVEALGPEVTVRSKTIPPFARRAGGAT
jgi:SAM-dependent methyltransferase